MVRIWKNRVFWTLAIGGLFAYLSVFFVGSDALLVGSSLWVLAFVYLLVSSIEKWTGFKRPT
ncbi:hypothetical protein [Thermococcus thioreducens]|uniref:Uncharacterized protein n=1 Tax=Thermococcus thioreducens TaxID=277988 RepID=A0A0Q2XLW7_9EURY|nr:hypothetical protein [Thermococcus thioreducens]ASJ12927.1 hypothetical protein A3L14_08530 [Thermococcus thioreducens]KQH82196.1 hypothetical protein AMR53_07085 [Thermococcus thioreducens]SEV83331.1 hypothetical protein SAMN05216170_0238 [Thermococcus thioreducens]